MADVAQEKTTDEIKGQAEQLDLPLISPEYRTLRAQALRDELGLVLPGELAGALDVAEQTLATWRSDGQGPTPTKLGKSVYYHRDDLQTWVKAGASVQAAKAA